MEKTPAILDNTGHLPGIGGDPAGSRTAGSFFYQFPFTHTESCRMVICSWTVEGYLGQPDRIRPGDAAVTTGILAGILLGWYRTLDAMFEPFITMPNASRG